MEGTADHLQLLFLGEAVEVHRIAGNANGERGILFGMLVGIHQHVAVEHVHVQVLRALHEIAVQNTHKVGDAGSFVLAERGRHNGEGVGNIVLADAEMPILPPAPVMCLLLLGILPWQFVCIRLEQPKFLS